MIQIEIPVSYGLGYSNNPSFFKSDRQYFEIPYHYDLIKQEFDGNTFISMDYDKFHFKLSELCKNYELKHIGHTWRSRIVAVLTFENADDAILFKLSYDEKEWLR